MNVLYEEDGGFKVASIMSEADSSVQIESLTGKRSKIKITHVLMRFEGSLNGFMENANAEAEALELDFLWQCCGENEFDFDRLAQDYYGEKPSATQSAGIAIKLHSAPMYFYRKGKGRYKAAPAETLKLALAAVERKRQQAEQMAIWVDELNTNKLPDGFIAKADTLIYQPDKNTLEWKAIEEAAKTSGRLVLQVMHDSGLIANAHDYHLGAFLREYFSKGTQFGAFEAMALLQDLPLAEVQAFSIDDSNTTEIDDALSVRKLDQNITRVGIHIAAPALGFAVGNLLDQQAMQRLSTVYMPGHKITMLPEVIIRPFSLDAGEIKPTLSLYLDVALDWTVVNHFSQVERVRISENLRHDTIEPFFNEMNCQTNSGHPYWEQLNFLFNFAESLEKGRGKYDPTRPPQVDYNFYVEDGKVRIINRQRGSPIDKLVAELMIEANSRWGKLLAEHGVAGIYRAQNGGKVYMTTKAEPHQGLGVAQYAWSTSPLRRAVDLVNQRQLIAVVQGEIAPYAQKQDALTTIMRHFDMTYNAYNEFQTRMERYWCLQYLIQENVQEITATVWRENLVRLSDLPYMTKVHSLPAMKSGTQVLLEIKRVDTLLMELDCKFKAVVKETEREQTAEEESQGDV